MFVARGLSSALPLLCVVFRFLTTREENEFIFKRKFNFLHYFFKAILTVMFKAIHKLSKFKAKSATDQWKSVSGN